MIPIAVPRIDDLGLPAVMKDLCYRKRGLVLITGSSGAGKSTSLAAMIQYINENRHCHVLTIEDPIEFMYRDIKASITQREVGADTHSFKEALFSGLRQDPDVIVIGEMRDMSVIQIALTAAETGHLVLGTMHTNDASGTIERILDSFPAESKNQIRMQLATSLVSVVSQQLLMRKDGSGRVPASEVMINSPAIEEYIMRNELERIPEAMSKSNDYYKMQTWNQSLEKLVIEGIISVSEALRASSTPEDLKMRLAGLNRMGDGDYIPDDFDQAG